MRGAYLAVELLALAGVVAVDARMRLFMWADARRATVVLAVGIVFFLVWDAIAIHAGFYGRGFGSSMLGVELAPHLPVEEVVFVAFLSYVTMLVLGIVRRALGAR
ncbi:MAG: lycopene cyclase domain-containing protein [Brevundimonas sp.]